MPAPPKLTDAQRRAALEKEAEARRVRAELKALINRKGASTKIEIDGGVNADNAPLLVEAGADALVAGSFVFRSENPKETIAGLKQF